MFAVVRTGGKQYRVEEGRAVRIDRIAGDPGDVVELGDVLVMGAGESVTVGAPAIEGARVVGTIAELVVIAAIGAFVIRRLYRRAFTR